jgi:type I restriction enzyme, S subunit
MKDSGVEWLGDIPEHWEIKRLRQLTEVINDINYEMPIAVDQGIPFLSAKDLLDDGTLNFEKDIKKISEEDFIRLSRKVCPKRNDIIYSRIGACLGKARIVEFDIKFLISYSCCVIRLCLELANPMFFKYFLDSELVLTEARLRTQGIGVPDLGLKQIARFTISVPSLEEQKEIVKFLDKKTAEIDRQKAKVKEAIALLKEYRTALITNAVTGKIDVRKEASLS